MPFLFNLDFVLFPAFAVQFNSLTLPLFPSFDFRPAPPPFFAFLQRLWFFGCLFTANWIKFKSSAVLIFVAVSLNEYTNALPSSSHQWRIWYLQPGWLINSATGGSNLFLFSLNPFFPVPYLCSCWNIVFYPTRIVSCDIVACRSSHQCWHWYLQPGWLINPTAGVFYMLLLNSTFLHLFVPCMLWYCCTLFCILLIILFNMCMLWYLLLKC